MKKTTAALIVIATLAVGVALSPDASAAACHWMWTPWAGWICA